MDVMNFMPTLSFQMNRPSPVEEHQRNFSRRAQRVFNENERSNLLAITQLVLNSFLNDQIRESKTRIIDAIETQEISDFFIMLEKCLWHGFKHSGKRKLLEAEMWHFIGLACKTNAEMDDLYRSVTEMGHLGTILSKFRAFWRLAMMQKKLADYFQCLYESNAKDNFYEPWALLRAESCVFLCGAFLALNVFDCNLLVDHDQLQEQINSFDLTPYLRLPTIPRQNLAVERAENDESSSSSNGNNTNNSIESDGNYTELKTILDQKQYLEERNRQLSIDIERLKSKTEEIVVFNENGGHSSQHPGGHVDSRSLIFTERLRDLEKERDILRARLAEKEDNLRLNQDQLEGTRRFTKDLYEKLRAADSKVKSLQMDMKQLRGLQEEELKQLMDSMQFLQGKDTKTSNDDDVEPAFEDTETETEEKSGQIRRELAIKTQKYVEAMSALKHKHDELSDERESGDALRRRCAELDSRVDALAHTEAELLSAREEVKSLRQELADAKLALQEFSEALSESKLRMVELKEEIMPLSEAQWVQDREAVQCRLCDVQFSVLHRRHHCRNCGQIFCNACTTGRIKLPSSSNPVRVCLNCYHLLHNRQLSIASLVDPRNTVTAGPNSMNASTSSTSLS